MKSASSLFLVFALASLPLASRAEAPAPAASDKEKPAAPANEPDPAAIDVINKVMTALQLDDLEQSVKESTKYLHKSLLSKAGDDISADLRRAGFKKARDNAKQYDVPVKVIRIRATGATSIGFKETAEKGKVVDYMLEKKGGKGLPTPVKIFFPESGEPKVAYIGSL
jgi:hypothetical protein